MRNHLERIVGLSCHRVDHHLTAVAHADERILVLDHLLDAEAVTRVIVERPPDLTTGVAKQDLALVRANEDLATFKPAMRRVVLRDVTVFFLVDCARLQSQILILLLEVLVGLFTSDEQHVRLEATELDFQASGMARRM